MSRFLSFSLFFSFLLFHHLVSSSFSEPACQPWSLSVNGSVAISVTAMSIYLKTLAKNSFFSCKNFIFFCPDVRRVLLKFFFLKKNALKLVFRVQRSVTLRAFGSLSVHGPLDSLFSKKQDSISAFSKIKNGICHSLAFEFFKTGIVSDSKKDVLHNFFQKTSLEPEFYVGQFPFAIGIRYRDS